MASPLLEEEGIPILQEWAPLTDLLQQIPMKAQRGIFTQDLYLTCVDILPEFIAVGTNLGLVYWYSRKKGDLQRLRCENTATAVTCVKVISTVDFMVAAGNDNGVVTVFQIPKLHPDGIPESLKPKKSKQVERYTISGLHSAPVTAVEWSMNGMKLFSGDKNGLVVLTEIDFYMHLSKSVELLNEKYEIVQLSYSHQLLLVSTLYRSIVCHREDRWIVAQVGQKERKTLGKLGATFCQGPGRPQDLVIYSSRPGLRVWRADKNGIVQQTLIYKDALTLSYPVAPLINPAPVHVKQSCGEHQFGALHMFRENLLVTHSSDIVYILDPATISVVASVTDLRGIKDVAVNKDEIFVLEGERSLIRVAYAPEPIPSPIEVSKQEQSQVDDMFSSIPVLRAETTTVASSLLDLTSKIKDSSIVPAIPFQNIFNHVGTEQSGSTDWNPIVTADEAVELPPIVSIPMDTVVGLHTEEFSSRTSIGHKGSKEVFNRSQQSSLDALYEANNSRAEVLDKIGEQDYENIIFKPKLRKRKSKVVKKKHNIISGTESGSDTMSTNSVRSAISDCEDQWSSERLDISSDWSSMSAKPGSNIVDKAHRSESEETLVRLGDSVISESGAFSDDDQYGVVANVADNKDILPSFLTRPDILHNLSTSKDFSRSDLLDVKPDLRSPASIERDVADKERILAGVLDFDALCIDHVKKKEPISESVKVENCYFNISEELSHNVQIDDLKSEECENYSLEQENRLTEEPLTSMSSILSYGPPSGSSVLPSNHSSLEMSDATLDLGTNDGSQFEVVERSDKWIQFQVPDPILYLSVCQHYVCCIDCKYKVYYSRLNGLGLRWKKLDYKSKQVAFSMNGNLVWKLVKDVAYALEKPSGKGPFGGTWHEAAEGIQFIAVDEGIVWLVTNDGHILVQKLLSINRPYSVSTSVQCPWRVSRVSCRNGAVWALTNIGEVVARIGISSINPEGKDWRRIVVPCPVVVNIAIGSRNTGWVISEKNVIYFTSDYTLPQPKWWQVFISDYIFQQSTALQQLRNKLADNYLLNLRSSAISLIALGSDTVWIAEKMATSVNMNKNEFSGHHWSKVTLKCYLPSIKWHEISAEGIFENKGQLWILSTSGDLFCTTPNSENLRALGLPSEIPVSCLAASSQSLWLLSIDGKIHVRQGLSDTCIDGMAWKELVLEQISDIHLTHISCGCDVVWACDKQGDVYMAVGSPHLMATSTFAPVWILVDDKSHRKHFFTKVFVGPQTFMVWALDNKGNVYVREAIFNDYQLGTDWVLVLGIEAVHLSVSGTAVWALSQSGSIYRRYGISQNNYIGDYWQKIPGTVASVTVSMSDGLWAVDQNMSLLRHNELTVKLSADAPTVQLYNSTAVAAGIDDGDWEVL